MSQNRKVVDTKFLQRAIAAGAGYTDPKQLIVTGPTLQEYLKQHYREGWDLFSLDSQGRGTENGQSVTYVMVVLVKYEGDNSKSGAGSLESQEDANS